MSRVALDVTARVVKLPVFSTLQVEGCAAGSSARGTGKAEGGESGKVVAVREVTRALMDPVSRTGADGASLRRGELLGEGFASLDVLNVAAPCMLVYVVRRRCSERAKMTYTVPEVLESTVTLA